MQTAPTLLLNAEPVVVHPCLLGEGPVWDERAQCLRWLDVLQGAIHSFFPATRAHRTLQLDQLVGAIAPRTAGGFIVALQKGFALLDMESGTYTMKAQPEKDKDTNRFNDGKCDPAGRFWAGTLALDETAGAGNLYMLEKDFSYTTKISGTTISNGMAWNKAQDKFYFIDTPTMEVVCYDYDRHTGTISNRRVAISIQKEDGYPDGMTIDDEDMLWVAHYNGWQVTRRNPENGAVLARITLPVARVTSCTFGGEDFSDLYITTASKEMSIAEQEAQPLAGALFVARNTGCKGYAPFPFST